MLAHSPVPNASVGKRLPSHLPAPLHETQSKEEVLAAAPFATVKLQAPDGSLMPQILYPRHCVKAICAAIVPMNRTTPTPTPTPHHTTKRARTHIPVSNSNQLSRANLPLSHGCTEHLGISNAVRLAHL